MRYYIITGEPSGDMHAANLVSELKSLDDNSIIRAWGGKRLVSEGVEISKDIKDISFMGLWSVIINIGVIKSNIEYCKKDLLAFKADALILVDYPGFNLKIAEFAKKNGIKVFYYISPKVWAWNKSRIYKIKKYVDYLLVIFPFEVEFYKDHGVEVTYVGNPLLDEIKKNNISFSYKESKPVIALLPGSRKQEVDKILPLMLSVVDDFPEYNFVIAGNKNFDKDYYTKFIRNDNVSLVYDQTYGLLKNSKYALVTSGTATLEAALFKVPQVVCYKTNWLTYIIGKLLIKINYLSLVNILLNHLVVKELIQLELTKENLRLEIDSMIKNQEDIISDYNKIINLLDKKGASKNAAKFILCN
ncbi:MAG: lipid-A-disaccharide synthase [Flavobacteriales bacterium]|nr:lipid-A-disaccharide synthase [Flavobacteriales bacterium]